MKKDFVDILACPADKAPLQLSVTSEKSGEIITGNLRCTRCGADYPISDGIPNLLPKELQEKQ